MAKIRFAMALHNHQPIGNFDGVFEAAYQDSYLPFLQVAANYPDIPFSLHTSGCLLEWLIERHPEYIEQLRHLVERGQAEIIGGAFYEAILPMIPARDRIGQIRGYSEFLFELFNTPVRGMWVAERVWEQNLVSDIAQAGIQYTILDDYHFRKAGLVSDQLFGYYLSEDQGKLLRIFPGSEPARYLIPFQEVDNLLRYLGEVHQRHPDALVVFADDGEKFGTWPGTKEHVYDHGWIYRFFDALRANRDWIEVCTLSQAVDELPPLGSVYLSDCSYREMTEWALPPDRLEEYQRIWHELDHAPHGGTIKEFFKGGFWRNFKTRYPETNEMYARMNLVSDQIDRLCGEYIEAIGDHRVHAARQELYRGQCNCAYWHGAFGGLYLPHLRNAIYTHLIRAENHLQEFEMGSDRRFVQVETRDLNYDGAADVLLSSDKLAAFFSPTQGGCLYELDVRPIAINVGASLSRRPEAYHAKVRAGGNQQQFGSIHDRVVFKQEGLDQHLHYDSYPRKTLVDHFLPDGASIADAQAGKLPECGDFVTGHYRSTAHSDGSEAVIVLSREGTVDGKRLMVTKTIHAQAGGDGLRIRYRLGQMQLDRPIRFAVEMNFAALAAGANDRYFHTPENSHLGSLGTVLDLHHADRIGLTDQWLGIDVGLSFSQPCGLWSFPIASVSQSEGGFELVHQSVCVIAYWLLLPDTNLWEVEIGLGLDTSAAEARRLVGVV